jgi:hypothetical protein
LLHPNLWNESLVESLIPRVETEIPPTSDSLRNRCYLADAKVASADRSSWGPRVSILYPSLFSLLMRGADLIDSHNLGNTIPCCF